MNPEPPFKPTAESSFDDDQTRQSTAVGNDNARSQSPYLIDNKFQPGDIVGDNYQIMELIGSGGMGHVYSVLHRILQKTYAMKTLSSDQVSEVAWRRLQVEAQAIARMNHPNIVSIHNLGLHQGKVPYYVMDLLHGSSLAQRLKARGPLELKPACGIFIEICNGLGLAHRKGIVHRDIKPGNIILLDQIDAAGARIKIVDFGIAKLAGASDPGNQNLTTAGEIFGSPYYMSPEQCEGKQIDSRSDIYSLGCTLFEILSGVPPFHGINHLGTMLMHQSDKPPTLQEASKGKEFPQSIENVVATMLAKAPLDRYQTLEQVAHDLQEIEHGRDVAASRYITRSLRHSANFTDLNDEANQFDLHGEEDDDDEDEEGHHQVDEEQDLEEAGAQRAKRVKLAAAGALMTLAAVIATTCSIYFNTGNSKTDGRNDTATDTKKDSVTAPSVVGESGSSKSAGENVAPKPGVPIASGDEVKFGKLLNGGKTIQFDFPREQSLGQIGVSGKLRTLTEAKGTVIFQKSDDLQFFPNDYALSHPEIFNSFRPDDFIALTTPARMDQLPDVSQAMPYIARLSGLERLDLKMSKATDSEVSYIDQLPKLHNLNLNMTSISGKAMAKLKCLKKLKVLYFSYNKDIPDLLAALAGSTRLTNLYLESPEKPLTDADIKLLTTCPNLMHLDLQASSATDHTLELLKSLKKLDFVDVTGCGISERAAADLRKYHKANRMRVITLDDSRDTFNKIGQPSPMDWIR
jgi:serine/threonine protein kinase